MNLGSFNPSEYDDDQFEPIPAGDYVATITEADMKPTRRGDGEYIKLTWQVQPGQHAHAGRLIWMNINWVNPNEAAVAIGKKQLASICRAVGLPASEIANFELGMILGKPCKISVAIRDASNGYSPSNEIKRIAKHEGASVANSTMQQPPWQDAQKVPF